MRSTKTRRWVMPRCPLGRPIVDAYLRMSDGFSGKEDNRENQLADIMELFDRNGWTLGEVLQDEVSAWKRGVRRDDFETLLQRIESGQSAGVAFYNQDRFLRRPMDLERFLLLWEDGRDDLVFASMYGAMNLNDGQQRAFARQMAANAMAASDDTSRRARRKNAGKRERGQLLKGGPRPFAWPGTEQLQDGETERREVLAETLEAERAALRWAFDVTVAGTHNLTEIAQEWNARGLMTFYGKQWDNVTVRQVMQLQRHAGRIEHGGEVVAEISDHEPTIDPATFDRVQMTFASRRRGRPPSQVYLCSGLIYCSDCMLPMRSRPRYRGGDTSKPIPTYICMRKPNGSGGCNRVIDQEPVDKMMRQLTISRLSDPSVANRISEYAMEADVRAVGIEAELMTARETEVLLTTKMAMGELSVEAYSKAHPIVMRRIQAMEAQLAQLSAAAEDLGAVRAQSELSVAAEWDGATVERRREMLASAIRLVRVAILPGGRGKGAPSRIPPEERVLIEPLVA